MNLCIQNIFVSVVAGCWVSKQLDKRPATRLDVSTSYVRHPHDYKQYAHAHEKSPARPQRSCSTPPDAAHRPVDGYAKGSAKSQKSGHSFRGLQGSRLTQSE